MLACGDLLDYVRLRAVCTSWRSGADSPRGRGLADRRFHPRRWMMFPEGHRIYPGHPDLGGCARFLHLDTGALVRAHVPLLGDSYWAVDSIDGLLLLVRDPDPDYGGAVRLLHPFTGDFAELPPLGTLLPHLGPQLHGCPPEYRIRKLARIVSASVSFDAAGAMTVTLALPEVGRAAFATPLDQQWTLSSWEHEMGFPLSFQGKLYVLHTPFGEDVHQVLQINPPVQQDGVGGGRVLPPPELIATVPEDKIPYPNLGLVECGSEILVLGNDYSDLYGTQIFVYKLADLALQRFVPIKSLGGNTLFMEQRNISVSSKILHTFKGDNVVYFTGSRIVQYHLGSDSLSTAVDNCSLFGRAPGPSPLVLYVFSCCIRNPWYVARCILLHFLSTPFPDTISLVLWVSLPLVLYFGPIAVNFLHCVLTGAGE